MIKYQLVCSIGHEFEGWFQSSAAFDAQAAAGHVACPICGSADVKKAVMAPSIATRAKLAAGDDPKRTRAIAFMRELRAELKENAEYVGPRFAEEARKIHDRKAEPREIYGEATAKDARSLIEDGVPVMPLPRLPEDDN